MIGVFAMDEQAITDDTEVAPGADDLPAAAHSMR